MGPRQKSDLPLQRADIQEAASIASRFPVEDADAKRFFLQIVEGLRNLKRSRIRVLGKDRSFDLLAKRINRLASGDFAGGV